MMSGSVILLIDFTEQAVKAVMISKLIIRYIFFLFILYYSNSMKNSLKMDTFFYR